MRVDLFDFNLPEENIALRPLANREDAKLLHVSHEGKIKDFFVKDLPSLLRAGDILVFNDTKVIPARLNGRRYRGENFVTISVTLHKDEDNGRWRAFVRPAKRLKIGDILIFYKENYEDGKKKLIAYVEDKCENGEVVLRFNAEGKLLDDLIFQYGFMPLPPYIASKRAQDAQDEKDYQTIFAKNNGAVASPTAGLHFTKTLISCLKAKGIESCFVTLHVGAGTFFPVKAEDTKDHVMHKEYAVLEDSAVKKLQDAKKNGGRIIAVGTTSLRVLESAATEKGVLTPYCASTDIFITPGYDFRIVDCLITNFHLPRSTLFMLVSAFCGLDVMQKAYKHAIEKKYRFYSYGDTSLLERIALPQ